MSKWKLLATALGIYLVHMFAGQNNAFAQIGVNAPVSWGSAPIYAFVGSSGGITKAVLQNIWTGECSFYHIGTASGLDNNYNIVGGGSGDFMVVVGGYTTSVNICGVNITSLLFNGHSCDVYGFGGADFIATGAGLSFGFGGEGDDIMLAFSGAGFLTGQNGNDRIFGSSAVTNDMIFGEEGNDCLTDPGNAHRFFDCGNGSDRFVSPASGANSCETPVTSC